MEVSKEGNYLLGHVQTLRTFLKIIGAWPSEAFGEKTYRKIFSKFIVVLTCMTGVAQINYLATNINLLTFFDMGDISMTMFLTGLTFIRAFLPAMNGYAIITREFLMEFHLVHFKTKGGFYEKICDQTNYFSHYFTVVMVANMVLGPTLFNLVPLYNNYVNGAFSQTKTESYKLQFSIYSLYPGFNPAEHLTAATILNFLLSVICSILVCGMDLFMSLMAFQIIGHIKVLLQELQHIPKPKQPIVTKILCTKTKRRTNLFLQTYGRHENDNIREEIVNIVKHHRSIVSFAGSVSRFFGPMLAFNYLYHLASCGLLLLECSLGEADTFARYIPITIITFCQLIQISLTFEIVGSESQKLKDAVYNIPWECMNIANQKLVLMFLCKIQIPIRVTALGMADVGVHTMVAILKTTFSYFAILQSMKE